LHALQLHNCQSACTNLGTPPACHCARQVESQWLAQFHANTQKLLTKRLDDRKPPKPGQPTHSGQRVRLNKAGVGPEVYSKYFDDQADITALLNVAEGNALEFANVSNGNPPMSGAAEACQHVLL
jgi:hypothetical protein